MEIGVAHAAVLNVDENLIWTRPLYWDFLVNESCEMLVYQHKDKR